MRSRYRVMDNPRDVAPKPGDMHQTNMQRTPDLPHQ
jgi:hypothetical protein